MTHDPSYRSSDSGLWLLSGAFAVGGAVGFYSGGDRHMPANIFKDEIVAVNIYSSKTDKTYNIHWLQHGDSTSVQDEYHSGDHALDQPLFDKTLYFKVSGVVQAKDKISFTAAEELSKNLADSLLREKPQDPKALSWADSVKISQEVQAKQVKGK